MNNQKKSFIVAITTIVAILLTVFLLANHFGNNTCPIYKLLLAPILTLGSDGGATIIAICVFLLIIGGVSNCLNNCGFIEYMLNKIVNKYRKQKYTLLAVIILFFMFLGSIIGSFEEAVPVVPIAVSLAIGLGFDAFVGIAISFLAVGCGFATGVANPFNIGVGQGIANLPLYSGVSLRLLSFVLIYVFLVAYVIRHAKKVEKDIDSTKLDNFVKDDKKEEALTIFATIFGIGIVNVLLSPFLTFLQDYTIIIIALTFLIAGLFASHIVYDDSKTIAKHFLAGVVEFLPSLVLILLASSIKYIVEATGFLDVMIDYLIAISSGMSKGALILFIYFICLLLEIFIPSGSAKAFVLLPLVLPIAQKFGISSQLVILAYAFGDGFANVLYPTNPALIICLSLVNENFGSWIKNTWKFFIVNYILTCGILLFGLFIGY